MKEADKVLEDYLRTYLKLDLNAIENNINEVKKRIDDNVKVLV